MKKYPYKKVDAFTGESSLGNPAAFVELEHELTPAEYLAFGKEHAGFVSEVVFCLPSEKYKRKLVYYSSECEVDFCGHGTVATMYELVKNDPELCSMSEIEVETNRKGVITVYNRLKTEDAVFISAPEARFLTVPAGKEKISAALGIDTSLLSPNYPVDFIDAGLKTLIVPIEKLSNEVSIYPSLEALRNFCVESGVDIVLIFSKQASTNGFIAHTRVFAPVFGYLEDPATGSGNSAFASYMLKNGMWSGEAVSVEQGGNKIAYNTVKLQKQGNEILFGGKATLRIEGQYFFS